jgi:HSP20 family protein
MAIIRRAQAAEVPQLRTEWDPFRLMRDLLADPFGEMTPYAARVPAFVPHFDVKETEEGYVFKADLPGVKEPDLDISLTGNRLTVSGKREAEERHEGETYFAFERTYGSFTRSFTLPDGADGEHVQAELKHGVLTLVLPKKPENQPRKITLKTGIADKGKA